MKKQDGFTIVELIVVAAIGLVVLTAVMISLKSFKSGDAIKRQAAYMMISNIRQAQMNAYIGKYPGGGPLNDPSLPRICGYGIHYLTKSSYLLYAGYAGPRDSSEECSLENKNWEIGKDLAISIYPLGKTGIEFVNSFPDIFFEIPDALASIDNAYTSTARIDIGTVDNDCAQTACRTVRVYPKSGKIDLDREQN